MRAPGSGAGIPPSRRCSKLRVARRILSWLATCRAAWQQRRSARLGWINARPSFLITAVMANPAALTALRVKPPNLAADTAHIVVAQKARGRQPKTVPGGVLAVPEIAGPLIGRLAVNRRIESPAPDLRASQMFLKRFRVRHQDVHEPGSGLVQVRRYELHLGHSGQLAPIQG